MLFRYLSSLLMMLILCIELGTSSASMVQPNKALSQSEEFESRYADSNLKYKEPEAKNYILAQVRHFQDKLKPCIAKMQPGSAILFRFVANVSSEGIVYNIETDQQSQLTACFRKQVSTLLLSPPPKSILVIGANIQMLADKQVAIDSKSDGGDAAIVISQESISPELKKRAYLDSINKRPRKVYASLKNKGPVEMYAEQCIKKIENIGSTQVIEIITNKQNRSSLVTFEILRSGAVASPEVLRSSGDSVFDDLSIRVVKAASPCDSMPEEVQKIADVVVVTRTFSFLKSNDANDK